MVGKTVSTILAFLLFTLSLVAQENSDQIKTTQSLFQMLETYHYNPPKRNSTLSNHIFESLVKRLIPIVCFSPVKPFPGLNLTAIRYVQITPC